MNGVALANIETLTDRNFPLQSLTENRIQALKSLALLLSNELKLLEDLYLRKDESASAEKAISLSDEVENFEIELIRLALARAKGSQRAAARLLKTKTSTLCAKIKRYGIEPQGITFVSAGEIEGDDFTSGKPS